MAQVVFYVFAAVAVLSAALCILQPNPVAAALWLVSTMFSLAGIYVLLNAQFIAAMQVLVYAGAVMVLFLFVIMLLNLSTEEEDVRRGPAALLGLLIAGGFIAAMVAVRDTSVAGLAARLGGAGAASSPLVALPGGGAVQSAEAFSN